MHRTAIEYPSHYYIHHDDNIQTILQFNSICSGYQDAINVINDLERRDANSDALVASPSMGESEEFGVVIDSWEKNDSRCYHCAFLPLLFALRSVLP